MILLNLDAASSLAPCSVCTWSLSERACQLVIIMWLMGRETSSTSLRMCRNILKCVSKSLCGFLRFGQPSTSDFLWLSKRNVSPIVQSVLKKYSFLMIKKVGGLVILKKVKVYMKTVCTMGKADLWFGSFFLGHLLFPEGLTFWYSNSEGTVGC